MAKHNITYKCGHEGVETLAGNAQQRANRVEWIESHNDCPACHKLAKQRINLERNSIEMLPALEGSDKQIAWAEQLRRKMIDKLEQFLQETRLNCQKHEHPANGALLLILSDAIAALRAQTSGKWFIEHKDHPVTSSSGNGLIDVLVPDHAARLAVLK